MLTLSKIHALSVGEKMVAYVGNFDYDIARCDKMSPNDRGASKYQALLELLRDELQRMHRDGYIAVHKFERQHHRTNNKGKAVEWRDFAYEVTKLK